MLNQALVAAEYGYLGEQIHMNCCSVGVAPARVRKATRDFFSGEYMDLVFNRLPEGFEYRRKQIRELLSKLFGGTEKDYAFVSSTAEGTSILATGYPLRPEDNVVITDLENLSGVNAWANARDNRGFTLRIVKTENGRFTPGDLLSGMDEHTRILFISAVQYGTGFLADLPAIGRLCREHGVILAVDAIQAVGRIPLNVDTIGIDYLTCGGFKALGAGFGAGFVYCNPNLLAKLRPAYAGASSSPVHISPPDVVPADYKLQRYSAARSLETGAQNIYGFTMLHHSAELLLELDPAEIFRHILTLERQLREALEPLCLQVQPLPEGSRSGIIAIRYPAFAYAEAQELFSRRLITLTLRSGYIRLALHCYNTPEQISTLAEAFRALDAFIRKHEKEHK